MSKYIKTIPLSQIERIQIYVNKSVKTLAQIKQETGADYLLNGGLYEGARAVCHLKVDGKVWVDNTSYQPQGYAWDGGADVAMMKIPASRRNYISCCQLIVGGRAEPKLYYNPDVGGSRQRTAMGLKGDKLCLYCTDGGVTPERLRDELAGLGWDSALMLDGGGSSQCDFLGERIIASRKVHNLILVYLKKGGEKPPKEEKPVKYTVCLDPAHGVESPGKCSPDKTYYERDFAMDMGRRVKAHLERCGMAVVLTRDNEHCPTGKADTNDLLKRAAISNQAGADLFVSLHSNASGDAWSTAKGLMIYTSAGPMTAARNVAAMAILTRMREAGVTVRSTPVVHELELVVTRQTNAPAVLIEYGFHTNKDEVALLKSGEYRAKLAEATAKGVCDFLGAAWVPEPAQDKPWYSEAQKWAVRLGIADGEQPDQAATRAEVWTMMQRLYEAVKAGK